MASSSSSNTSDEDNPPPPPEKEEEVEVEMEKKKKINMATTFGSPVQMAKAFKNMGKAITSPVVAGVDKTIQGAKNTQKSMKKMVSSRHGTESARDDESSHRNMRNLVMKKKSSKKPSQSEEKTPEASIEHKKTKATAKKKELPKKESALDRIKGILRRETTATMGEVCVFSIALSVIPTLLAWDQVMKNQVPALVALAWCFSVLLVDRSVYRMEREKPVEEVTEPEPQEKSVERELTDHTPREPLPSQLLKLNYPPPPPPPTELPARFLAAGKGDPVVGQQRLDETLEWRKEHSIDYILRQRHEQFTLIKKHYPHFFHLRGKDNSPVYFESPPKTNLKALREGGCDLDILLRHYAMVTEFMWQHVERSDSARSIYIVDLDGIGIRDFAGEVVDFVKQTTKFTGAHYPERMGIMMVINVPSWFKMIYNVLKPLVDEDTLKKIAILRGKDEIFNALSERIPIEHIPPEYGGKSVPLGEAPEEKLLWDLMAHNNDPGKYAEVSPEKDSYFRKFELARSY